MNTQSINQACSLENFFKHPMVLQGDTDDMQPRIEIIRTAKGEHLFRSDEAASYMYALRSGLIKLTQLRVDGDHRIIRLVRPGDLVGLRSLLGQPHKYDAVAMMPTVACRIPVTDLRSICSRLPTLRDEIYARWQHTVDEASNWLVDLSSGSARSRIANLMLMLKDAESDIVRHVPTRQDMASILGVKTETVSRLYSELKKSGYIARKSSGEVEIDVEALRAIAFES